MMFLTARKLLQIVGVCFLVGLSAPLLGAEHLAAATALPPTVPVEAVAQQAEPGLSVEGRLVPGKFANLAPKLTGRVEQVLVQEGDRVEAGQVLLRLEERDSILAELAANDLELLLARNALDQLHKNADLERAQAERDVAQAQKEVADATYKVKKLKAGTPQALVDQAYANMILAENALDKLRDELQRTEKQFANKNNPILFFISNRQVKLILTVMERNVVSAQRRYEDSTRKYEDLKAPADPVELAQAEADLSVAQARLAEAERQTAALHDGPDPDEVAAAQARIQVAETALAASKSALMEVELLAPFSGQVVDVGVKAGEWVEVAQPVVVLADMTDWIVETSDLTEIDIPQVAAGQTVSVTPDALEDLTLGGVVESIKGLYEEKRGDVTYTTRIALQESDPRLRWGMTVAVTFED